MSASCITLPQEPVAQTVSLRRFLPLPNSIQQAHCITIKVAKHRLRCSANCQFASISPPAKFDSTSPLHHNKSSEGLAPLQRKLSVCVDFSPCQIRFNQPIASQ